MAHSCKIENGEVQFCTHMDLVCQPANASAKGLVALRLTNLQTGLKRLAGVIYKTQPHSKGTLLNVCPWCGEDIDATHVGKV